MITPGGGPFPPEQGGGAHTAKIVALATSRRGVFAQTRLSAFALFYVIQQIILETRPRVCYLMTRVISLGVYTRDQGPKRIKSRTVGYILPGYQPTN